MQPVMKEREEKESLDGTRRLVLSPSLTLVDKIKELLVPHKF